MRISLPIRWVLSLVSFMMLVRTTGAFQAAQPPAASGPSPTQLASQEDRQRMMNLLHIASLRPGATGNNPQAPNAANYDEAKANP